MSDWKQRRFWEKVDVVQTPEGFGVTLDSRTVKTPAKRGLIVPSRAVAEAIAQEWRAQEKMVDPGTMPFTRSANAALDKVAVQHAEVADMIAAYGDADLLCYRAGSPDRLVAQQAEAWDPMLAWASQTLDVTLVARQGVMHVAQDPAALAKLSEMTHALDTFELTAFHDLVSLSGSLVLGFAALKGTHDAGALWRLSRLDELWQIEQWGVDDEAEEMAAVKESAFLHAKAFLDAHHAR